MARSTPAADGPDADLAARLAAAIRTVPDFPRPGIHFRDITTLLADGAAFRAAVDAIAASHGDQAIDVVVGIESRGFVIGAPVAYVLGASFAPIRKQGRLPAETISAAYALEYGEAVLEIHADAIARGRRVLIVDDLLATGGTAVAAIHLVEALGGVVAGIAFLIELADLGGSAALEGREYTALIKL
jgi:adenine phosphoribosyltransferase